MPICNVFSTSGTTPDSQQNAGAPSGHSVHIRNLTMLLTKRYLHKSATSLAFNLRSRLTPEINIKTNADTGTLADQSTQSCNHEAAEHTDHTRVHSHVHEHEHSTHKHSPLLVQPDYPVRTRFAPSPTGFLHLGSLRTALYNYLLAKSTGGQFLLRLEDTDQNRLVPGAEESIYKTLDWLNIEIDEGPIHPGPHSPYRQSERSAIYRKYADELLNKDIAYRCFCSKDRLDGLRDSARLLKPPTTVSYDRNCLHNISKEESDERAANGESFTVRFKSPENYPEFVDLLHGNINLQPQINPVDRRFEDPVLMKSDNLPTYHFANVIDDHLMKITHVIRGEEWIASTPKHIALYDAFGWEKPNFIHIPLLTAITGKKLSKRSGDIDIMKLKEEGYLGPALINFAVLFGWNPKRELGEKTSEIMNLAELKKVFDLGGLTKGSTKVTWKKLDFFNKHYLTEKLQDHDSDYFQNAVRECHASVTKTLDLPNLDVKKVEEVLKIVYPSLTKIGDFDTAKYHYFFQRPLVERAGIFRKTRSTKAIIKAMTEELSTYSSRLAKDFDATMIMLEQKHPEWKKTNLMLTLRYALSGPQSGTNLSAIAKFLGAEEMQERLWNLRKVVK